MIDIKQLKYEFAQTGWRQSIAVNIAAQIVWVIIPIVFVSALLLLNTIEKDLTNIFSYKIDALNHRVSNIVLHSPQLSNEEKNEVIRKIADELGFYAVEVVAPDYQLFVKNIPDDAVATSRTLAITGDDNPYENGFLVIKSYHQPLENIISQKRKNILAIILLCLVTFSVFLVFSIRTWLYKPLKTLVDATESAATGNTEIILDTERKDEFGHLSLFFSQMIANLAEKHDNLREVAKAANSANHAKSRFLANMSHELRTPLNAIIGYSEMLLDEARQNNHSMYIDDLQKSISASKHLLNLINEVLDLSKIEAGKMETYISPVDLGSLIADIQSTIEPLVKQNNNTLIVERDADVHVFESDITKIRQILINLLGNACKFTENGKITLKVKCENDNGKDLIKFNVMDTGIGINEKTLDSLFSPFTQEDNSFTRSYSGTGLGLSISQRLCQLLGGNITVQSTKGKGSCFTITLPMNSESIVNNTPNDSYFRKAVTGT